jgi:hypothetical protein
MIRPRPAVSRERALAVMRAFLRTLERLDARAARPEPRR